MLLQITRVSWPIYSRERQLVARSSENCNSVSTVSMRPKSVHTCGDCCFHDQKLVIKMSTKTEQPSRRTIIVVSQFRARDYSNSLLSRAVVNEQFGLCLQTYRENFMSKEKTVRALYRFYGLEIHTKTIQNAKSFSLLMRLS